jgi:hypothetical protein
MASTSSTGTAGRDRRAGARATSCASSSAGTSASACRRGRRVRAASASCRDRVARRSLHSRHMQGRSSAAPPTALRVAVARGQLGREFRLVVSALGVHLREQALLLVGARLVELDEARRRRVHHLVRCAADGVRKGARITTAPPSPREAAPSSPAPTGRCPACERSRGSSGAGGGHQRGSPASVLSFRSPSFPPSATACSPTQRSAREVLLLRAKRCCFTPRASTSSAARFAAWPTAKRRTTAPTRDGETGASR